MTTLPTHRSTVEHLTNIRQVLNPTIADLVATFDVSRQTIYQWISGRSIPEDNKLERIRSLSFVADTFQQAGITRAESLLKMKVFDCSTLLDLVATGQFVPEYAQTLIAEAQAMEAAYNSSGLAKSKAAPSNGWQAEFSIPGSSE